MKINLKQFVVFSAASLSLMACSGSPELIGADDPRNDDPVCVINAAEDQPANANTVNLKHLIGAVHEHSGFSDGTIGTTPQSYYEAGRDLGLNFMLGSEHSDGLILPITFDEGCISAQLLDCLILPSPENPGGSLTKWAYTADLATNASTDNFTAVRGFEWTSDRFGHANIFFSSNQLDAKTTDGYLLSMEGLWTWFGLDAGLGGGDDGILVFNHPGREDAIHSNIPDPAYTFNDFEYRASVSDRVVGVEMFGKGSDAYDVENGAPTEGWYARALDRGWKLGPTGSEDEHGTSWAQEIRAKTVILAEENNPEGIKNAMLARRMYALAQHHNNIRMTFTADGLVMGSSYAPPEGTLVELSGSITEAFPEGGRLELVSNGGEIVAQSNSANISHTVGVDATERWYYQRLLSADGLPVAYSSPVWLKVGDDAIPCS